MRAQAGAAALVVAILTGCQASEQAKQQEPESVASSPMPSSGSPEQTPTLGGREPSAINSMPLALVVNATRPTADVRLADARRVVESGGTRWSAIGQSGGQMRVLTTRDRRAAEVLRAVRESGGSVVAVEEAEIVQALRDLARLGLYVEPTAAAAAAGLTRLLASGVIREREDTVLVLTGSGLKASATIGDLLKLAARPGH